MAGSSSPPLQQLLLLLLLLPSWHLSCLLSLLIVPTRAEVAEVAEAEAAAEAEAEAIVAMDRHFFATGLLFTYPRTTRLYPHFGSRRSVEGG
jgi:hypothetical protein